MNPLNSIVLMLATGQEIAISVVAMFFLKAVADRKGRQFSETLYAEYHADPAVKRAMAKIKEAHAHPNFGETGLGLPWPLFQEFKAAELVLQQRHPRVY